MNPKKAQLLIKSVVDMIPQWHLAEDGHGKHELWIDGKNRVSFHSIAPSAKLESVRAFAQENLAKWYEQMERIENTAGAEMIQEVVALHWLKQENPNVAWLKLLQYLRELSFRTFENQPVNLNLVISSEKGRFDVTDLGLLAPLFTSQRVFLRVDPEMRFLGYEEILWSNVKESEEYKYNPEFLQPFASILQEREFSVHLTQRGDLVITNANGMLACKRKGRWYLYEPRSLVRGIEQIYRERNGNQVGRNLFEVLLDLSFKRHGALLIFDPDQSVQIEGTIPPSPERKGSDLSRMLEETMEGIRIGGMPRAWKKGLLIELASLDGAVIFNTHRVCACGAMITTHKDAGADRGARSTAARSARLWGGIPAKVSSDGDISILFRKSSGGEVRDVELKFL